MKQLILIFLYCSTSILHAQEIEPNMLIGKWTVESAQIGNSITFCRSSKEQIEEVQRNLENNFLEANFTLYTTNRIKYHAKNDETDYSAMDLSKVGWKINMQNKIDLIYENVVLTNSKLEYLNGKLIFDYLGIVFVLKR